MKVFHEFQGLHWEGLRASWLRLISCVGGDVGKGTSTSHLGKVVVKDPCEEAAGSKVET
jgi:hypothetical protein